MIHQDIYLKDYDWYLSVWYAQTKYNLAGVVTDLQWVECPGYRLREFMSLMKEGRYNCGMTYSNYNLRSSVMVIGLADSPEQYANSIAHEAAHLGVQIADADEMDLRDEPFCYLIGKIAEKMHPVSHRLTCMCHG